MARRVDQVQVVNLAIARLVLQRGGLRLDGYPPLFLDVHRVKHLLAHLTVRQAAATRDEPIGQRGLAVVNMGDDGKISDVLHHMPVKMWLFSFMGVRTHHPRLKEHQKEKRRDPTKYAPCGALQCPLVVIRFCWAVPFYPRTC